MVQLRLLKLLKIVQQIAQLTTNKLVILRQLMKTKIKIPEIAKPAQKETRTKRFLDLLKVIPHWTGIQLSKQKIPKQELPNKALDLELKVHRRMMGLRQESKPALRLTLDRINLNSVAFLVEKNS